MSDLILHPARSVNIKLGTQQAKSPAVNVPGSPVNTYTKKQIDEKLDKKADKTEVDEDLKQIQDWADDAFKSVDAGLDAKVNKETGKGLSAVEDASIYVITDMSPDGSQLLDEYLQLQIDKTDGTTSIDLYNRSQVNSKLAEKAPKATTLAGYGITDAYTKDETDGLLLDKADKDDLTEYVKGTDYATYEKHGVVKASGSFGVGVNTQGIMTIRKATDAQIDAGIDGYAPIVSSNAGHAVKTHTDTEIKSDGEMPVSGAAVYEQIAKITPKGEASGETIVLTDHLENAPLIDYKAYGNSVQATRSGKNLIDIQRRTLSNGTIKEITGIDSGDYCFLFKTYNNTTGVTARIYVYDTGGVGSYLSVSSISSSKSNGGIAACNFTYDKDLYPRIYVACYCSESNVEADNFMLVSGSYTANTLPDYEPYGVSPSPEYPSEIQSVGELVAEGEHYGKYKIPIEVRGKNLLNPAGIEKAGTGTKYGEFELIGDTAIFTTAEESYGLSLFRGNLKLNTQYTISMNASFTGTCSGSYGLRVKVGQNGEWGPVQYDNLTYTFTTDETAPYIAITYYVGFPYTKVGDVLTVTNIQLEEGAAATEYEPYSGGTYTVYANEPLRKVGDYVDYVDFENQQIVRKVGQYKFTGAERVNAYSVGGAYNGFAVPCLPNTLTRADGLCNYYRISKVAQEQQDSIWIGVNNNIIYFINNSFYDGEAEDKGVKEFKTWLVSCYTNGNPVTIYYPLDEPVNEPIEVPAITVPKSSIAYISEGTSVKGSMEVKYYQDINKKLAELQTAITVLGGV